MVKYTFLFASFLTMISKRRVNSTHQLSFQIIDGWQLRTQAGEESPYVRMCGLPDIISPTNLQHCGCFAIDFYAHGSVTFISFCSTNHLFCFCVMLFQIVGRFQGKRYFMS